MRIISGEYRSRKLQSPPEHSTTRPIPDRVKESLFSLLRGNIEGAAVLDVFAGTGAIGLEALSRGAARCVFVERDKRVADVLKRNIETLGDDCIERSEVVVGDALGIGVLARCPRPVDLIFFDPPYDLVRDAHAGGGWDRVKAQFARLIENLSDGGFASLRTPWPFVHPDDPEEGEAHDREEERKKKGKHKHPARRRPEDEAFDSRWGTQADEDDEEIDPDDPEAGLEGADAESSEDPASLKRIKRHVVDLRIPGAVGPETHGYRHTAVHLYMRKKGGGSAADAETGA